MCLWWFELSSYGSCSSNWCLGCWTSNSKLLHFLRGSLWNFDFKLHEGKCDRTDLMPLKSLLHSVQVIIKTALYFGNSQASRWTAVLFILLLLFWFFGFWVFFNWNTTSLIKMAIKFVFIKKVLGRLHLILKEERRTTLPTELGICHFHSLYFGWPKEGKQDWYYSSWWPELMIPS